MIRFLVALGLSAGLVVSVNGCRHVKQPAVQDESYQNERIYSQFVSATVWIRNGNSEATGTIISSALRLVVTNQHVTNGAGRVEVIFPSPRANNRGVFSKRSWYEKHEETLKDQGYYTSGRVVAEDKDNDLALVMLDSTPSTITEIRIDEMKTCDDMSENDLLHILGNPGTMDLFRWTAGHFQGCGEKHVSIGAGVFKGNSGGPVLDNEGGLVGIVARSTFHMHAIAVPAIHVTNLLYSLFSSEENEVRIFTIENRLDFPVEFAVRWNDNSKLTWNLLESGGAWNFWLAGDATNDYSPLVEFDYLIDGEKYTGKTVRVWPDILYVSPNEDIRKTFYRVKAEQIYYFDYTNDRKELDLYR